MSGSANETKAGETGVAGPVLREARMHVVTPAAPVVGRVVETRRCTASEKSAGIVRHVSIDVSGTPLAGSFIAGQSFGVLAPGLDANGKPHKLRLYSIASPTFGEDGNGNVLATTVKRSIDEHWETGKLFLGVCSNYLCDLKVGDEVKVTGPSGKRFVLPAEPEKHDYLFFATGTGIAPFRGMITELLAKKVPSRIVLILGSAYATDLLYDAEMKAFAAQHANFTYLTAVSREKSGSGMFAGRGMYVQDRLKDSGSALMPMLLNARTLIYVCGIAGMELGIFQQLARTLPEDVLPQYLSVDASELGRERIDAWQRTMIQKAIRPTRRVFLEVY